MGLFFSYLDLFLDPTLKLYNQYIMMIGNGGYTYTKKGDLANGKSAWICTQRGPEKKCPAHITCHEINGVMKVFEYFHTHVHDPDATSISRNKVSSTQAFLQVHLK